MGTTIVVDSVVYNMAGEEENRPDYLKSLVIRNVLSGTKDSMGDTFRNGYLKGPAIKLRQFYRWAENPDNYGEVGLPTGALEIHGALDPAMVSSAISHGVGQTVWVQSAKVGYADHYYWADQWIIANRPAEAGTGWTADFNEDLNEITITFVDTTVQTISPADFDYLQRYIYAYYSVVEEDAEQLPVTGSTVILEITDSFPSTTDWTFISEDPGPPIHRIYEKQTLTSDPDSSDLNVLIETMHQFENGADRSYRIDTQEVAYRSYSDTTLLIYRIGSGNALLDALVTNSVDYGEFFPFIPLRIKNEFLSETYGPEAFEQVKKAYKKATGSKLSKLIEELEDNESLEDIDNAYITFGVSLNVVEDACKKYVYNLFEQLQVSQAGGPNIYSQWKADIASQQAVFDAWIAWAQEQRSKPPNENNYDPEPERPVFPEMPSNQVRISGTGELNSRYDVRIEWAFISDGAGTGPGKTGAKKGDLWFEYLGQDSITKSLYLVQDPNALNLTRETAVYEKIRLYWQREDNSYTWLEIIGLVFRNYVYKGKAVVISAKEALEDPKESGFIVPLHYDTWRQMSLVDTSQMATACVFIVFNCYVVHKTKWYQSGIFRIILVIAIAIASVIFTGGAGVGLLGAHLSVGVSLGFTGMTAAIVGSIANALVALVLATLLEKLAGNLGALGAIISTLIMIVVGQVAGALQNPGALAINWGDMLRVDNLLKLTDAIGRGITNSLHQDTLGMHEEFQDYMKQAGRESNNIQQAYFKEFGYGNGQIDPLMFVDSSNSFLAESSDTFLTRTLMTGSEIADMSRELLYNFPEYTLTLPDAFT